MAHKHSVYDSDTHFIINPITRVITNASSQKTTLMQYDHNSERFTFEMPRHIEGHDMITCNKVEVHFINIDASTKARHCDKYEVVDLQTSPDDENTIICSWLISKYATQYVGSLNFILRFICLTDDIDYIWNTAIHDKITISSGISNGNEIVDQNADILEQWEKELFESTGFAWTDFDYTANENAFAEVGETYISVMENDPITIHCAGEILGFTVHVYAPYYRLKVNGEYVLDNQSWESVEQTYTLTPTLMEEDIVLEVAMGTLNFSNMTRRQVRGMEDFNTALDTILAIQTELIGGES